jgi:hypothetical protein
MNESLCIQVNFHAGLQQVIIIRPGCCIHPMRIRYPEARILPWRPQSLA